MRVLIVLSLLAAAACGTTGKGAPTKKALVPAVLPKAKPEALAFFEEGLRHVRRGSLEAARDQFAKAVKADKKLFEGWHDLGVVEGRLGRWDQAIAALEQALILQPASRRTVIALGEILGKAGRWPAAASVYGERLAADPDDRDVRMRYIQALRDGDKAPEALEQVKAILAKDSKNAAAFNALGLVYYRMEKLALAESAFRRAIELEPKAKATAAVWNNLGLVALARGRDQEAFAAFAKATEVDGSYREAYLNQANVYLDCGDYKRAEKEIRRALEIEADDPDAHVALGVALRGQRRFDDARQAYERALAQRPNHPPALYALGILYMDFQPDKAKARESLSLYRSLAAPGDPRREDAAARLKELR